MNVKPRRTLTALFAVPTRHNVRFSDIAALIIALGGEVREGAGSRVVFEGAPVIIAAQIKKGDQAVRLRKDSGVPVWSGGRRR